MICPKLKKIRCATGRGVAWQILIQSHQIIRVQVQVRIGFLRFDFFLISGARHKNRHTITSQTSAAFDLKPVLWFDFIFQSALQRFQAAPFLAKFRSWVGRVAL